MVSDTTFTGNEPYVAFLAAYPFPAFVFDKCNQTPLRPVYGNGPYARFVSGPGETNDSVISNLPLVGLSDSLSNVEENRRLSDWLQDQNAEPARTLLVTLKPPWLPREDTPIQLEVTKTQMERFWVCTSVPRTALPAAVRNTDPTKQLQVRRRTPPKLKLPDFPPPPKFPLHPMTVHPQPTSSAYSKSPGNFLTTLVSSPTPYGIAEPTINSMGVTFGASLGPTSSGQCDSRGSPDIYSVPPVMHSPGETERMFESFPWEKTVLGPKEGWSSALMTAIRFCLSSPLCSGLFCGPDLILIYNDEYAQMAGSKHPGIFGKPGREAWADIWHKIGSMICPVLEGQSFSKTDDLFFFERRIGENRPEEMYHTWSWIPVQGEDGKVEAIINWSTETTQKVVAQRRLLTLRSMGERAKVAKNVLQLTSALLTSLEKNPQDVPFAAFYYCQAPQRVPRQEESVGEFPSTSFIRSSLDQSPLHLHLSLVGAIGVPDNHPATPVKRQLSLARMNYRSNASAGPPNDLSRPNISEGPIGTRSNPLSTAQSRLTSPMTSIRSSPGAETRPLGPLYGANFAPTNTTDSRDSLSTMSDISSGTATSAPWTWPIEEAVASGRPVLVSIPKEVAETLSRRPWGDVPRQAVVVPIRAFESDDLDTVLPKAVLIMGVNPRREYDNDYADWIDVFGTSLGVSMATVLSWEAETRRAEQLAQLDAAKTSFFSNASHELRTPLTLIMGPIQDAINEIKDPKIHEKLKIAGRNVSRLSRLVDSLMDFTRIEAGKSFGQFKPVQLDVFTSELASLFRSTIEKSSIEFRVECDTSASQNCYVDPDLWEKIVFNLIGNAFKYTMEGSIVIRITYQGTQVAFTVEDTGVGIPSDDIEKVFQRFHRVASICRSYEGTGIGLSLTKELVHLHGGILSVKSQTSAESRDGSHGSTFTVRLPLGKDHLPPDHINDNVSETHRQQHYARCIVEEATYWSRPNGTVTTPSDSGDSGSGGSSEVGRLDFSTFFFLKKDVILLVDDNSDMRQYIKSIFSRFCCVIEAVHGQEALDIINAGVRPDLIISDVMMPIMDGYDLIKSLRGRPDTKLLPIILLTAKAGEESRVGGLLSGADDYIAKPFQGRELVARAHLQMQLGKRRSELEERFEERQREIKILSEHSPIGIVRTDPNGRITYSNPRWFELTGTSGRPVDEWIESIHPEYRETVVNLWREVFEERSCGSLEFRWLNGVWTNGQIVPLGNEKIGCTGVLFTITDISDQRLYEASQLFHAKEREATARRRAEEAEERRKEADERRRGQELLIDVTSHELRQPVSAILNCSALVRENLAKLRYNLGECYQQGTNFCPSQKLLGVMEEDLEALDSIYQCGLAQERIANDVLSLSRIQLQVLSIHPVEFDIVKEVRQILGIFHNELKMKGIRMSLNVNDSIEKLQIHRVRSDKSRFAQVLTNLLSNAIKFADTSIEERQIQVTLDVSFKPPKGGSCAPPEEYDIPDDTDVPVYLYVAVKDSGPGLKPEDLNLLFKRFQQGSNSHEVFGGSGLGLFVCRKLCELLNGGIEVDSVYGSGATFRFFIKASNSPIRAHSQGLGDHLPEEGGTINLRTGRESSTGAFSTVTGRSDPPHILITEDNLINQTVLNRQLKGAGFATTLASHGQQAIDRILAMSNKDSGQSHSRQKFDAILMDCEMPVMDGLTAVREIRRLEATGRLQGRNRIYALTGNARSGQIQCARDAGMDDVLIKPYKIDELLAKLNEN